MNGGYLGSVADVTTGRATTVGPLGGGLNTAAGTTLTHTGTISGPGVLGKLGDGTAILTGNNSYTGGTVLNDGVLQVANDANLGAPSAPLGFVGGTLRTTADMSTARVALVGSTGGTLETVAGTTAHL